MPKHLTPAVHESWLWRDVQFPARPNYADSFSSGRQESCTGACGESSSTGTGARPLSLALTPPPKGEPVPVGHLSLIERIKEAAK